ncbi:MAG: histidine kinase [Ahrensia sp.]|nr:histidine kinase [Ahrensia sp.]
MPSLIRFIVTIGIFAGLVYGAMFALVAYVKPNTREMTERVPTDKINPVRIPQPVAVPENADNGSVAN